MIGLLLSSLIGGEVVPSSLCVLEPSPPFVVIIPLVLEGGRACSSVLVGIIESPGDCDLDRFRDSTGFSITGVGEEDVTGVIGNEPVTDEGECVLRRVLAPGFAKLGGVNGGIPVMLGPSDPVPLLEDGELDVDKGC